MSRVGEYLGRVASIGDVVRADAAEADRSRRLGEATLAALRETGLTRVLVPTELGGGGLSMAELYPVVEAMARVDGSAGWNLNIQAVSALFAAALGDDGARDEVLGDPGAFVCGTLNVLGLTARRVDGGYVFDGRATYLSGSSYARWLAIAGWLQEDGVPQFDGAMPRAVRGIAPIEQVPLEDTWHVGGMRATASHDATIDGLFVPDRWMCDPARDVLLAVDGSGSLATPVRFGGALASVGIGCARGAIDALDEIAGDRSALSTFKTIRERVDVHIDVGRAAALADAASAAVARTWDHLLGCAAAGPLQVADAARWRLAVVLAAEHAQDATDLVRRAAGSAGLYERDRIERCWRDAHAVPAHVLTSPRGYERAGRVVLGLDALPGIL